MNSLNDYVFWRELGAALGQEADWPWETSRKFGCIAWALIMANEGHATPRRFYPRKRGESQARKAQIP
jgi:hypothetical protein